MSIKLNDNIYIEGGKPMDSKYYSSDNIPYLDLNHALSGVTSSYRYLGLTINVNGEEYWFKSGISDTDLTKKVLENVIEVTDGILNLTVYDSTQIIDMNFEVYDSNENIVYSGTSYNTPITLNNGVYSLKILTEGLHNIQNMTIVSDNYTQNNSNTTIGIDRIYNIDIGVIQTEIISNVTPVGVPILDYVIINSGQDEISSGLLTIDFSYIGVAYEYMLSYNTSFTGGVWNTITSTTIEHDYGNYLVDTDVDIYFKVRNTIGESETRHDSIRLINGISRSDSSKTYNSLKTCILEIEDEYPSGLTQDVSIDVSSNVYDKLTSGIFFIEIDDFNVDTPYFLTINGNGLMNIDCFTRGGIKINRSDNIIFKGINFSNVSSMANASSPEQISAIFARGTTEKKISSIIISNCTVDGLYIETDNTTYYGTYGFVFNNIENLSIINTEFTNIGLIAIDIDTSYTTTFSNINVHNCNVTRGLISQPSLLRCKQTQLLYIDDSIIDGTNHDTGAIITNVNNIILKRNKFRNITSEALRVSSSVEISNFIVESCLFHDILTRPYYYWTKQHIGIVGVVDNFELINNTIKLNEVNYTDSFPRFVYFSDMINNIRFFNNIFDFRFLNKLNNAAQSPIFLGNKVNNIEADYNVYRDYTLDYNDISNMFYDIEDTSPLDLERVQELSVLRSYGLDINSTLLNFTDTLYDTEFDEIADNIAALPIDTNKIPTYDINKNITSNPNVGAYFKLSADTTETDNILYIGLDVSENKFFYTGSTEIVFSNSDLIFIADNVEKNIYFEWIFEDSQSNQTKKYGISTLVNLISNNDESGDYVADEPYSIEIKKIT